MSSGQEIPNRTTDAGSSGDRDAQRRPLQPDHATHAYLQPQEILPAEDHTPSVTSYIIGFLKKIGCACITRQELEAIRQDVLLEDAQNTGRRSSIEAALSGNPPFERRLELANALVDRITTYLNDPEIDLTPMEGKKHLQNFKEHFKNFERNILEYQQYLNDKQTSSANLDQMNQSLSQLEKLFNALDTLKEFNKAILGASYRNDDYQEFIDANQNLENFPIYKNFLTHFGDFQDHITQDEEHLESLLDSHEVNIEDLSQKSQALTEKQNRLDTLFQGAQEIKKFNEALTEANLKNEEIRLLIGTQQDLARFTAYRQLCNHFQKLEECIEQSGEYLTGKKPKLIDLPQKHKNLTDSHNRAATSFKEFFEAIQLKAILDDSEKKQVEFNQGDFENQSKRFGMEKYANICFDNLKNSISEAQQHLWNSQASSEDALEKLRNKIIYSKIELDKYLTIIEFRKRLPTAEAIINHYEVNISKNVLDEYKMSFDEYWSEIEEKQTGRKPNNEELKERLKARSEHIEKLVKETYMCMRLKPGRLKDALKRGRMPSTFDELEIGKSHSSDAKLPRFRMEADKFLIGYPIELPAELRPLYAFLTRRKDGSHSYKKLKSYGGIIIRYKESVGQRSTITLDDTGYTTDLTYIRCRPDPYYKPSIKSFPSILARLEKPGEYILDPLKCDSIEDIGRYAEAQMHGGLPIDDIEEVIFTSPKYIDDELKSLLKDKKRGVAYRILEPDQYELNIDWVNPGLAVGGSIHPEEIKALGPQGIMHVVDTRAEQCDDSQALQGENIQFLHLPMSDNYPLSIEDLRKGTDWVKERLTQGERVLIHCEDGVDRSVLLTCAVLVTQGMAASEALKLVKEQREQADPNPEQFARLQEFEEMYRAGKLGKGDSQ